MKDLKLDIETGMVYRGCVSPSQRLEFLPVVNSEDEGDCSETYRGGFMTEPRIPMSPKKIINSAEVLP
jgi:hypothetical protein